jgi:hypothetical protein
MAPFSFHFFVFFKDIFAPLFTKLIELIDIYSSKNLLLTVLVIFSLLLQLELEQEHFSGPTNPTYGTLSEHRFKIFYLLNFTFIFMLVIHHIKGTVS